MGKLISLIPLIILCLTANGQVNRFGVPLIQNYGQEFLNGTDYVWSFAKDNLGVIYMGTNGKGIVRFDGHNWTVIKIPGDPVIRVLKNTDDGVIYVGGSSEFGYLQPSTDGTTEYVSISGSFLESIADTTAEENAQIPSNLRIGEIYSIAATDSLVYFCGLESLYIYHPENGKTEFLSLRNLGLRSAVKMIRTDNRIIIADNMKGINELKGKNLIPVPGGDFFGRKICMAILPAGENELFIGTYTDGTFLFNYVTGQVSANPPVPAGINEKLKNAQILTATCLPTGEILVGTQQEGIFVFDKNYRFIGKWDSNTSNLPDNTVANLFSLDDVSSELWVSTTYSVSKVYVNLPYYELSGRNGLEGAINNLAMFNGNVFVATDLGLFKSQVNESGYLEFQKVGNLNYQTFSLCVGGRNRDEFLLAGTGLGLYCIRRDGSIYRVDDIIQNQNIQSGSAYFYYVRSITQSKVNPNRYYIGLDSKGLIELDFDGRRWKFIRSVRANIRGYVVSMIENERGDLHIYSANPVGLLFLAANDSIPVEFTSEEGIPDVSINGITSVDGKIIAVTGKGLYRYDDKTHSWLAGDDLLNGYSLNLNCKDLYSDNDGDLWLSAVGDRLHEMYFRRDSSQIKMVRGLFNILPGVEKYDFRHFDDRVWVPKSKSIFVIDKSRLIVPDPKVNTLLTKIIIGKDSVLMSGSFYKTQKNGKRIPHVNNTDNNTAEIEYSYNSMSFFWAVPFFIEEEASLFSYKLEGFDKDWSKWDKVYYKDYTNLPYGKYTFRVKGITATEIVTEEAVFEFFILKPWYLTTVMILLYVAAFIVLIILIIKAYTRKLKNENIQLEGIIAERTAVVVKQKEELESSIHYARRIQMALLPSEAILAENLENYFILFKPRDIVSGDFYWMTKKENRLYIVAADCTGHGVPGAFMSLLGMSFLDEIIDKEHSPRANYILSELREHVTDSLKQSGGDDEAKDGMDMALLVVDYNSHRIEFSGAYNPCFRVRRLSEEDQKKYGESDKEMPDGSMTNGIYLLETIYASKMPIGISSRMNEDFVLYEWDLEKGVSYYLFSDGYIDQFGGSNGRKFMKKSFKRLLLEIQDMPMKKQKEILEEKLIEWMGQMPQIDDILVMGIRTD